MRILLAGATGAIGKRLGPLLVSGGHTVVGLTRTPGKTDLLRLAGVEPAVVDGLDEAAVREIVRWAQPQVVVHEMTALADVLNLKHFDREFEVTNRLRTEGTQYLLAAALEVGASRFIAQSYTGWSNVRAGGPVKNEMDPLDPNPPASMRQSLAAILRLEETVSRADGIIGIVLRYGSLYGPGTSLGERGDLTEMVRHRRFPIFGSGAGIWSFIHVDDAAAATKLAIEQGHAGIYNIVDDEPTEVSTWLTGLAESVGAKPPFHLPEWIGRLAIGEAGLSMMNQVRGSSNLKAKSTLGWQPAYPSWREGFRRGLSAPSPLRPKSEV